MKHVDALSRNNDGTRSVMMIIRSQQNVASKIKAVQSKDDFVRYIKNW